MRVFWRMTKEFIRRPRWWFFGWLAETEIVDRIIQEEMERPGAAGKAVRGEGV